MFYCVLTECVIEPRKQGDRIIRSTPMDGKIFMEFYRGRWGHDAQLVGEWGKIINNSGMVPGAVLVIVWSGERFFSEELGWVGCQWLWGALLRLFLLGVGVVITIVLCVIWYDMSDIGRDGQDGTTWGEDYPVFLKVDPGGKIICLKSETCAWKIQSKF